MVAVVTRKVESYLHCLGRRTVTKRVIRIRRWIPWPIPPDLPLLPPPGSLFVPVHCRRRYGGGSLLVGPSIVVARGSGRRRRQYLPTNPTRIVRCGVRMLEGSVSSVTLRLPLFFGSIISEATGS